MHAPSFSHLQLFHNIVIVNTDPVRTSTTPVRCDDVADGEVLAGGVERVPRPLVLLDGPAVLYRIRITKSA